MEYRLRLAAKNLNKIKQSEDKMNDNDEHIEITGNPLIMPGVGFAMWLSGKGVDLIGTPPADPIARAALLFEFVKAGKIDINEMKTYLGEIGLMMPLTEN